MTQDPQNHQVGQLSARPPGIFETPKGVYFPKIHSILGDILRAQDQRCKFLSPGRPRLPVLGQGYLFPEAGSPGGRPKNAISQLLFIPQNSITTQFAVEMTK